MGRQGCSSNAQVFICGGPRARPPTPPFPSGCRKTGSRRGSASGKALPCFFARSPARPLCKKIFATFFVWPGFFDTTRSVSFVLQQRGGVLCRKNIPVCSHPRRALGLPQGKLYPLFPSSGKRPALCAPRGPVFWRAPQAPPFLPAVFWRLPPVFCCRRKFVIHRAMQHTGTIPLCPRLYGGCLFLLDFT